MIVYFAQSLAAHTIQGQLQPEGGGDLNQLVFEVEMRVM
jgi:hypothetical protein